MASFGETDISDAMSSEANVSAVKSIPIRINKLVNDKGKLKQSDVVTFESEPSSKMIFLKNQDKSSSFKVKNDTNINYSYFETFKRAQSGKHWLENIRDQDSYEILKNIKINNQEKESNKNNFERTNKDNFIPILEEIKPNESPSELEQMQILD